MRLVIFDADGTLVDSQAIIHEAMRLMLIEHGQAPLPIEATRKIIGLTLNRAIAQMLGRPIDDEIEAMSDTYKRKYLELQKLPQMRSHLYEGISEVINILAGQRQTLLAIATGKSRRGLMSLIETHGFEAHFTAWRSADDCPSKPHPAMILECCEETGCEPQNTVMIGDASFDMEMAVSAGAKALGVGWGYQSVEQLKMSGAQTIVQKPAQLPLAIDKLLGN